MANIIQIKRSSTAAAVPTAGQLAVGELAVNLADKKLYTKDSGGTVLELTTKTEELIASDLTWTGSQRGAISALTDDTTITPNFSDSNNFSVTLGGNRTLANPTNIVAGQSGVIIITQDATGNRTLAYGSYWKFANGIVLPLTVDANAVDVLAYFVESSTRITARLITDVK